ncbi:MAG: hypothetical protein FJW23_01745, partial [Acidimicrobiia bacterium]|nr:hypothetical protein [Acidimicrobiia bacterium]
MAAWLLAAATPAGAQVRGIQAEIHALVERDGVHAGTDVRAALRVSLPDGFHTQSDTPRDPTLIPTVLRFEPPPGVEVVEVVYPPASDLIQEGQAEPLAVFEQTFAIGVLFRLGGVGEGPLDVPGRLRYQACDDRLCYAPVTADVSWTLDVVPASVSGTPQHEDVIAAIPYGTGAPPEAPPAPAA